MGLVPAQVVWYQTWSGRYTGLFLLSVLGLMDLERVYPAVAGAVFLSTCLAMLALVAAVTGNRWGRAWTVVVAGVLTVLYLAGLPDVAQTIYWATGSLMYQMGNVGVLLLVAILACGEQGAPSPVLRGLLWMAGVVLVALLPGANDVTMLLTVCLLAVGTLTAFRARRPTVAFWASLLVVGLLGAGVAGLAPGNYARAAAIAADDTMLRPRPLLAAILFLPWTVLRATYWLSSLGLWAATLLLLGASWRWARGLLYRDGAFDRHYLQVPVVWVSAYVLLSLLGFVANLYPLPERGESVLWLLFLLGWFPSAVILTHWLTGETLERYTARLFVPAVVLLTLSILGAPNNFEAFKDTYRGYRYHLEMARRHELIRAAKASGQTDVLLPSLSRPPRTLLATEITTDPDNFRNRCLAEYHGFRSIRLGSTGPSHGRNGSDWMGGNRAR